MAAHDDKTKATVATVSYDLDVLSKAIAILEEVAKKDLTGLDAIRTGDVTKLIPTLRVIMGDDFSSDDMHRLGVLIQQNCPHEFHYGYGFLYTVRGLKEHILFEATESSSDFHFFVRALEHIDCMMEDGPEDFGETFDADLILKELQTVMHKRGMSESNMKRLNGHIREQYQRDRVLENSDSDIVDVLFRLKHHAMLELEATMGPCKKRRKICHKEVLPETAADV